MQKTKSEEWEYAQVIITRNKMRYMLNDINNKQVEPLSTACVQAPRGIKTKRNDKCSWSIYKLGNRLYVQLPWKALNALYVYPMNGRLISASCSSGIARA